MATDCPVYLSGWNLIAHTPLVAPCRHTVCEQCLGNPSRACCPVCRAALPDTKSSLPRNYSLLEGSNTSRGTNTNTNVNTNTSTACGAGGN